MTTLPDHPQAFWFGTGAARAFGLLHRPVAAPSRGVVICDTVGFEGLLADATMRDLADALTEQGFAVLRFNYPGTGDSSGGPKDPGLVRQWIDSVHDGISVLRTRGVTDVALLGFRFGATVATAAAMERSDVSRLVTWVPAARGSSFVRELTAMSRMAAAHRPPQPFAAPHFPDDALEAVGFEFARSTLDDIKAIDLQSDLKAAPAPAVLVLDKTGDTKSEPFIAALEAAGSRVDREFFDGYDDFIVDNQQNSIIPPTVISQMTGWLSQPWGDTPPPAFGPAVAIDDQLFVHDGRNNHFFGPDAAATNVVETVEWIDDQVFCIVARPIDSNRRRGHTLVMFNTGLVNRAGPGRLHVAMSRHLADEGMTAVRVDLGGAGDSVLNGPGSDLQPYAPARTIEAARVVEWARTADGGPEADVSVFGVCSGATTALRTASSGISLRDVFMVNTLVFSALGDDSDESDVHDFEADKALLSASMFATGMGSAGRWKRFFDGSMSMTFVVTRIRGLLADGAVRGMWHIGKARIRSKAAQLGLPISANAPIGRDLARMAERGTRASFLFTEGEPGLRNLRVLGGPVLDDLCSTGFVEVINIPGGDHVVSPTGARHLLINEVFDRLLDSNRPTPAGATPSLRPPTQGRFTSWISN